MNEPYCEHPSEDALERFLLNMPPEGGNEIVETHLLACEYCVDQVGTLEIQIAATRLALKEFKEDRALRKPVARSRSWKNWFTIPTLSFAGASAALLAGLAFLSMPSDVSLTAFRGTETAIVSQGRPLHVHLNAMSLLPGPVAIELADRQGAIEWKGTALIRRDSVDVTLPRITRSGPHFLRLYSLPRAGSDTELLREFVLDAQWTL